MISGETIRFIRKRRNLTQQELSELIGISRTTINDWENNKKRISKASESKLEEVFGDELRVPAVTIRSQSSRSAIGLKAGCVYRV